MSETTDATTTDASPESTEPNAPSTTSAPPATPDLATQPHGGDTDGTDWKAEARKWEQRAKQNSKAASDLQKLQADAMSEQEKALAAARSDAKAEAAREYGAKLALAELRAQASTKGVDVTSVLDLIDPTRFLDEAGEVDVKAVTKALAALGTPKASPTPTAPPPPSRSGGDHRGGTGAGQPITRAQLAGMSSEDIATAYSEGRLTHLLS